MGANRKIDKPSLKNSQGRQFFLTFRLTFLAGRGIFYLDVEDRQTNENAL